MKLESKPVNRSEHLRERRSQKSEKRIEQVSSRARAGSAHTQQVIIRGGYGSPIVRRTQTKPRRQFAIALGSSTELITPAIPDIHLGWRLASGLLVLLLGFAIIYMSSAASYKIKSPIIFGMQRVTTADIEAVLNVRGEPLFAIDTRVAEQQLAGAFPELADIQVEMAAYNHLVIRARERQPIVAWANDGETLWIDDQGAIFFPRGDAGSLLTIQADTNPPLERVKTPLEEPSLKTKPKVENPGADIPITQRQVKPAFLETAIKLSSELPPETNLAYNTYNGLGWVDTRGWTIYIGSTLDDLDQKLLVYEGMVAKLEKAGVRPAMISVEYVHAPFYRLEH
jgi:cell division protein FtsQ